MHRKRRKSRKRRSRRKRGGWFGDVVEGDDVAIGGFEEKKRYRIYKKIPAQYADGEDAGFLEGRREAKPGDVLITKIEGDTIHYIKNQDFNVGTMWGDDSRADLNSTWKTDAAAKTIELHEIAAYEVWVDDMGEAAAAAGAEAAEAASGGLPPGTPRKKQGLGGGRRRTRRRRRKRSQRGRGGLSKGRPRRRQRKRTRKKYKWKKKPKFVLLDSDDIEFGSTIDGQSNDSSDFWFNFSNNESTVDKTKTDNKMKTCENCGQILFGAEAQTHTTAYCIKQQKERERKRRIQELQRRRAAPGGNMGFPDNNAAASNFASRYRGGGGRRKKGHQTRRRGRRRRRRSRRNRRKKRRKKRG